MFRALGHLQGPVALLATLATRREQIHGSVDYTNSEQPMRGLDRAAAETQ